MNRAVLKYVAIFALAACAVTSALHFVPSERRVWIARFSYYIAPGEGGIPFLGRNKEWAEKFCSVAFSSNVVSQCRERAACNAEDIALFETVTGAVIRVSRERDAVLCDFSTAANSSRLAAEVARAYLEEMHMAVEEENRKIAKKAISEISASLSKHEALARAAREKCHEAQIAGKASLGGLRVAAEELSSKCDRLRRELAEIEQAVAMQNDCIVVVRPLSVMVEKGNSLTDHGKSSRR